MNLTVNTITAAVAISILACTPTGGDTDTALPTATTETDETATTRQDQDTDSGTTHGTTDGPTSTAGSTGSTNPPTCNDDTCQALDAWCTAGDDECAKLNLVCPGNPCDGCSIAAEMCEVIGGCDVVAEICESVDACDCSYPCDIPASDLSFDQLFSLCIVHPWSIGLETCRNPESSMCLAVMQSDCAPTACEYLDCLDALEDDPCSMPPECSGIAACGDKT